MFSWSNVKVGYVHINAFESSIVHIKDVHVGKKINHILNLPALIFSLYLTPVTKTPTIFDLLMIPRTHSQTVLSIQFYSSILFLVANMFMFFKKYVSTCSIFASQKPVQFSFMLSTVSYHNKPNQLQSEICQLDVSGTLLATQRLFQAAYKWHISHLKRMTCDLREFPAEKNCM